MKANKLFCIFYFSILSLTGYAQVAEYTVSLTGEKIKIGPVTETISVSTNYTEPGRTVVNNQGRYFGWFLYSGKDQAIEARWGVWQGDVLAQAGEIYQFDIRQNGNNGRRIPIYIGNLPAGKYTMKPLIKSEGDDYWVIPRDKSNYGDEYEDRFSYKNWEYTIEDIEAHKAPSVLLLCSEGLSDELIGGNGIPNLFNEAEQRSRYERFDAFVRFSNKSNTAKKGKIKLLWERDYGKFWLGYSKASGSMTYWSDCITRGATMNGFTDWEGAGLPVEIPAHTDDMRFDIKGCCASTYYEWGTMYTPYVHVYFQPEGSDEWILCGIDAGDEFDANHRIIRSVYQKNCNSFALWITDAEDHVGWSGKETITYNRIAKTLVVGNVVEGSYVFIYDMDGETVKAEPDVNEGRYSFSTAALGTGSYLLKIIPGSGKGVGTMKITL